MLRLTKFIDKNSKYNFNLIQFKYFMNKFKMSNFWEMNKRDFMLFVKTKILKRVNVL